MRPSLPRRDTKPPHGVQTIMLRVPPVAAPDDAAVLDAAEQARAARFHFDADRSAFVTTRAALRRELARRLSCTPDAVTFAIGAHGRPELHAVHASAIDFNVSHSGSMAVLAFTEDGRVGVDLEWHGRGRDLRELVTAVMGASERAHLDAAETEDEFVAAFYACWTRKEAVVKGIGTGITAELTAIDVAPPPDDAVVTMPAATYPRWMVRTVSVAADVTLSIALAGDDPMRVVMRPVSPELRALS